MGQRRGEDTKEPLGATSRRPVLPADDSLRGATGTTVPCKDLLGGGVSVGFVAAASAVNPRRRDAKHANPRRLCTSGRFTQCESRFAKLRLVFRLSARLRLRPTWCTMRVLQFCEVAR